MQGNPIAGYVQLSTNNQSTWTNLPFEMPRDSMFPFLRSSLCNDFGTVIHVKPECTEEYKRYHAAVGPEVLSKISECNIRNYSVFIKENVLFGYFEYHGTDIKKDWTKMAADPKTQEWWAIV